MPPDKSALFPGSQGQQPFLALYGPQDPHAASGDTTDLDAWLAEAHACGIRAVETFTARLKQDGAAVRAAPTEPWTAAKPEARSIGSSC